MNATKIQAVILKQVVEYILGPCRNTFRERIKQKRQTEFVMYVCKLTPSVPASPASLSTSSISFPSAPLRQQDNSSSSSLPQPTQCKDNEN